MTSDNKSIGFPVGTSSLLMIFIVLCLTTFAAISYIKANNDFKLSLKSAQSMTEYYQADSEAEKMVKNIDDSLELSRNKGHFLDLLRQYDLEIKSEQNQVLISYIVPIKDTLELQVELEVFYLDKRYQIKQWKVVNTHIGDDTPQYYNLLDF